MKKIDKFKLKLLIDNFIEKCWVDLRGLRGHFLNELFSGMSKDVKSNKKPKTVDSWLKRMQEVTREDGRTLRKLCLEPSASGSEDDDIIKSRYILTTPKEFCTFCSHTIKEGRSREKIVQKKPSTSLNSKM